MCIHMYYVQKYKLQMYACTFVSFSVYSFTSHAYVNVISLFGILSFIPSLIIYIFIYPIIIKP